MSVLEKLTVIMLDVTTYTGRKSLSKVEKARMGIDAPEDLLSVGYKKVIDPKEVAIFQTLKKNVERLCYKHGARFLGGFAVEANKAQELMREIKVIKEQYEDARSEFIASYEQKIKAWRSQHPGYESMISDSLTAGQLKHKLRFGVQTVQVMPVESDCSNLDEKVEGLGGRVLHEISQDANRLWDASLRGRDRVSQKVLNPIRAMKDKLDSLSFVDPRLSPMVTHIESVLAELPKAGYMESGDVAKIAGLVLVLARGDGYISPSEKVTVEPSKDVEANESVTETPKENEGVKEVIEAEVQSSESKPKVVSLPLKEDADDEPEESEYQGDIAANWF